MFKNPLKYQAGGQMTQDQQQMLAAFIQWLPQRVPEFQGMQPEAIVQALDGMSKTPEGQKQVQAYMEAFQQEINGEQPSATFKKGGKINAFVCKHAKGGYVAGCNCKENGGEIEIDKNGKRISRYSDRNTWGKATSQGDTTINGSYSDHSQEMKITPKGTIYREWNNGDMFPSVSVANQTYFDNHPLIRFFSRNFGIGPKLVKGNEEVVTNMNAAKDAHQNAWIPSNQEGGELTRKEALRLGRENKGYNRSQSRFAYQNAKNTLRNNSNLRGKELRQTARQWVAGQNEQPQSRVLSAPMSYGESVPTAQPINYLTEHNESLSNLSFNDAFARARRAGAQTFWWPRGRYKLYNTELGTSGNQAGDINNSAEIVAIPNLPVIDTNFNIPDIVADENSIPQVALNLADTTPVVNISDISEPIVQSSLESTTESVSKPNNSDYFVEEYLRTHFPNGARRNFIARNIYGQQRNLINETSPLFIGPVRPGTVQSRKIGGKVVKGQNGIGHKEQKMFDSVTNKITSKTQNISPITGMRYEQPLVPEYPEMDAALMAIQPGTIIEKLIAPGAYKGMIQALHEGDTESLLHGLMPASKIKYIPEGAQSPYKWIPSKEYIREAAERGTDVDDFLFALKRNPKLGTNPKEMYGKFGNASTKKIRLNPTAEEVENTVYDIFERYGIK